MKRRIGTLLLALLMVLSLLPAPAMALEASGTCGENLTWVLDDDGVLTISGTGAMDSFSSGDTRPWENYQQTIQSVSLPQGLTHIGDYSFDGMQKLSSVTIPNTVISIGKHAFEDTGIETLVIPEGVTSIGDFSFFQCDSMVSLSLPGTLRTIGTHAFAGCKQVKKLTIPEGVTMIGGSAFQLCDGVTELSLPGTITTIPTNCFWRCNGLTEVTIPENVTEIGAYAFEDCRGLTRITLPETLKKVGKKAFGDCVNLTQLHIPAKVTVFNATRVKNCISLEAMTVSQDNTAFCAVENVLYSKDMTQLIWVPKNVTEFDVPEGITTIAESAFAGCTMLTRITFPTTLTTMEATAFGDCTSLEELTFLGDAPAIADTAFSGVTAEVTYPPENTTWTYEMCRNYGGTLTWKDTVPSGTCGENLTWKLDADGVMTISGTGAMENYYNTSAPWYDLNITALVLQEGVTTVGARAFRGCTALNSITFLGDAPTIGSYAFRGCTSLKSITFPGDACSIGDEAFTDCTSLETITFLGDAPTIGAYAFERCTALNSITFLGDAPTIKYHAFGGVTAVVTFPLDNATWTYGIYKNYGGTLTWKDMVPSGTCGENLTWRLENDGVLTISGTGDMKHYTGTSAPWYALYADITSVVIQQGVTSIGNCAFLACYATKIQIPASVASIGDRAFHNCRYLTEYELADGNQNYSTVDGILCSLDGTVLVSYPGGLKTLTIPESVTTIGRYAFGGNSKLSTIVLPEGITTIDSYAFSGCEVRTITLPDSLTHLCEGAFAQAISLGEVNFGKGLTEIPSSAFASCHSLDKLSIPEGVTTLGSGCVLECDDLKYIELPTTLTELKAEALIGFGEFVGSYEPLNVVFRGDAPRISDTAFGNSQVITWYPADNATWTADVIRQYKDIALWQPYTDCIHRYRYGRCDYCGGACPHVWKGDSCCLCNEVCDHSWQKGTCTKCGSDCVHSWEADTCVTCGTRCYHSWSEGACTVCGMACDHSWGSRGCVICAMPCPHSWNNSICAYCYQVCQHTFIGNICGVCEKVKDESLDCVATLTGSFNNWSTVANMHIRKHPHSVGKEIICASMELQAGTYSFQILYNGVRYGASERHTVNPDAGFWLWENHDPCQVVLPYDGTYEVHFDPERCYVNFYYIPQKMYLRGGENDWGTELEMTLDQEKSVFTATTILDPGTYSWVMTDEHGLITGSVKDYDLLERAEVHAAIGVYYRFFYYQPYSC